MDLYKAYMDAEEALNNQDYESAHKQYDWLFEHAEKIEPSYRGVRLSYGLAGWSEVAKHYSPAMERLLELQQLALQRYHQTSECKAFRDFARLSRYLEKQADVLKEFERVAQSDTSQAKDVFYWAYDDLVADKQWLTCAQYLDDEMINQKYDLALLCFDNIKKRDDSVAESLTDEQKNESRRIRNEIITRDLVNLFHCLAVMPTENQFVEYKSKAKQDLTERELSQLLEQLEQVK
ncbi:hypothetical protein LDJ79_13905 [Vibrio tritonius]|uniref:Uncharacterized protein n=1 Tax=Vibrio tritonius TaxID=1435069 RepID=A0ABS7YSK7_9VIBR|nr:hypothetical protein [Vibrio tritonius]MCA2017214.1 hypothetical protein [Vibrio tritonius]